ncbi:MULTISPECIES: hypothetical protein [Tsukamurella]|uniref:Peptidase M41 domain-containing protein n=1 Tax=Tsukamurella strandjordii TaxID=147577 RepID=A0AA90NHH6_9ACTN|nr:hypothetical protein [Tsukamurella strandjordii]MDP0399208.1 hypothetical protein [Tsukamurella strandjordii]
MTPTKRPPDATREAATQIEAARERAAMAVHEAAHAVAAVLLGGHVELSVLDPEDRSDLKGLTTVAEDSLTADAQAQIAWAGPYAEARFDAGRRPTWRGIDAAMARSGHGDLAMITAAGGPVQADVGRVEKIVEDEWPAVLRLARRIARDGYGTHWHALAELGFPAGDTGGPTSFTLSCIRAGMRPAPRR